VLLPLKLLVLVPAVVADKLVGQQILANVPVVAAVVEWQLNM
jgi:hypothetical protein